MISNFLSQRGHSKIASLEEMGRGSLIIWHDSYLTGEGGILESATSCNLIKEIKGKRVRKPFGSF